MRAAALALALVVPCAWAQAPQPARIAPGDNLVVEGIPPIPASIAEKAARYAEFRTASMQTWHPTRREMLVTSRAGETDQVHAVREPQGARTQLTFFPDRISSASYQPVQGRYFIFSKDVGGGEWYQLYRYDIDGGAITLLTDGKARNTGGVWDRDGKNIAYMSTRRTGRDNDLWVMNPADPRSDKLLAQLEGGGWYAEDWSRDGKWISLVEYMSANESRIWLMDAATGQKKRVTPASADAVAWREGQFTADGRSLYVATDKDFEFRRLALLEIATGKITYLTSDIPWDVSQVTLSRDGSRLAFVTNEAGVGRLHVMDTATHTHRVVADMPPGIVSSPNWHDNGRDLGFTYTSAKSPGDAYSVDTRTGAVTRWTTGETGGLDTAQFPDAQSVSWKSFDGRAITGFLYAPPARFTGKRPVIVHIHGGPEVQARPQFLGRLNYYLNELGVAVLYPNVRGSSGYGKTFVKLDNGFLREDSYKDIGTLLDWIKAQPNLDGDRILVTGGSYGGHMTLAVASNYSDKICCSIDVVGMSNLVTFLENTESYRRDLRRVEYGDERDPKMREFLERIAPLNKAANIRKPLFVVQGRNDPRVPASEALQIVQTLRKSDTPVWFLMANDEGHGFAKRKNRDFQFYAEIMFMEQYLLR
jgi:dipeptidyl aminopeptidase/acylaminoacyl peptidase